MKLDWNKPLVTRTGAPAKLIRKTSDFPGESSFPGKYWVEVGGEVRRYHHSGKPNGRKYQPHQLDLFNPLDFSRPITTRDGRPVQIVRVDPGNSGYRSEWPVVAVVSGLGNYIRFRIWGGFEYHGSISDSDLINVDVLPFDPSKPAWTKSGLRARIVRTDFGGLYPIEAAFGNRLEYYTKEGRWNVYYESSSDLTNIPPAGQPLSCVDKAINTVGDTGALDLSKPVWTKSGLPARITHIDRAGLYPIFAEIGEPTGAIVRCYTKEGAWHTPELPDELDLTNTPPQECQVRKDLPVTTRDGRPARIISVDGAGAFPIAAWIREPDGTDELRAYRANGRRLDGLNESPWDLVNI